MTWVLPPDSFLHLWAAWFYPKSHLSGNFPCQPPRLGQVPLDQGPAIREWSHFIVMVAQMAHSIDCQFLDSKDVASFVPAFNPQCLAYQRYLLNEFISDWLNNEQFKKTFTLTNYWIRQKLPYKNKQTALAGVAQWSECQSGNQRVAGLISSRAHAWVVGQVPCTGAWEATTRCCFLIFLLPFPCIQKQIKS